MKQIITIGRQFGSGGREIGLKLAEKLNIRCYDKDILKAAARKMGICESVLAKTEESNTSLLYSLVMNTLSENPEDQLAKYEKQYLRKQAEKGSCIIIGRCGNHVFRNDPALISFYISAPLEQRVKTIMERQYVDEKEALRRIQITDKKRANYYNYHTDQKWADLNQYQFVLDSSVLGIDGTVELMETICQKIHNS